MSRSLASTIDVHHNSGLRLVPCSPDTVEAAPQQSKPRGIRHKSSEGCPPYFLQRRAAITLGSKASSIIWGGAFSLVSLSRRGLGGGCRWVWGVFWGVGGGWLVVYEW